MSYLVKTKNSFETLIMETSLTKHNYKFTRESTNYIEVHTRFLDEQLIWILMQHADEIVNKHKTMDNTFKLIQLLP